MAVTLYRKIYLFPLKHQFTNGHLIFDKEIKNTHWGKKDSILNKWCRPNWMVHLEDFR